MTRTHKIVLLVVCVTVILPTLLIVSRAYRIEQYRDGFAQIELEQNREKVIDLMGEASENRGCNYPIYNVNQKLIGDCVEILTYHGVYEEWTLALDKNGNVIEKYYWFLGEYGKRPPDR